ncbi:MAG: hypothetical protein ABF649_21395 [Bacillus sp. (in: firmicutes)]
MLVLFIDILISLMTLTITFFSINTLKFNSSTLKNIAAAYQGFGILLVGTGMYIGGGSSFHTYLYITFTIQLIILGLFLLVYYLPFKKVGHSKLINIYSLCLVTISYLMYVYYIIASFIYY